MSAPLDLKVLEAAAQWYVELRETGHTSTQQAAHEQWLAADPRHRQAWARVQRLEQTLARIEPVIARPALGRVRASRRDTLKVLSVLLAAGGSTALGWQFAPWKQALADYHTGTGVQRRLRLDDGSRLTLDTRSAVDVRYSQQLREIHLHAGQVLIETAADPLARPFIVHSAHGSSRALGTRFILRCDAEQSQLDVLQHAVEVRPAAAPEQVSLVTSGQRLRFSAERTGQVEALPAHVDAWSRGLLVISDWRLADFLAELSRYRPGHIRATPAVAELRISGVFQLTNIDGVLDNLATTLPVRVNRFTRYWAQLEAR